MDLKDDIRARLPIEQLVGQYCQLQKKGRNYVCLCPFHNDKNPSFLVSPDKGIGYCFACQSGGDIFSFVQKIESVDFPSAIRILAEKAGIDPKLYELRPQSGPTKDEKDRLRECLQATAVFYRSKLRAVPHAFEYVTKRGVPGELIEAFGIGYAPDSYSETYDHLLKAGFSRTEIVAAGLGIQKDLHDQKIYDRFRHRIQFPITDAQGQVIGFGGRTMGDSDAKYVNSPESPLYHKSSVLFGLSHAKEEIRKSRRVMLVEGYFDCIAAHKAGIKNVVAVSGTALTDEHVKILRRYADEVLLCLDQDTAGQLAASRAFGLLSKAQFRILSVTLPAKDPDELIQKDMDLFRTIVIEKAKPYLDAVIEKLAARQDLREASGRSTVAEILFPLLSSLQSSVELRSYIQQAAHRFGIIESDLESDYKKWLVSGLQTKSVEIQNLENLPYSPADLSIGIALLHPAARPMIVEMISMEDTRKENIKSALMKAQKTDENSSIIDSMELEPQAKEYLKILLLFCEENFGSWSESLALKECKKMVAAANRDLMTKKQMDIVKDLRDARQRGRVDEEAKLLVQYSQLLKLTKMAAR